MPQLAAFPKAYMTELCKTGTMRLSEWIDLASTLEVDGLEFYCGFLDLDPQRVANGVALARKQAEEKGLVIPMLCCSPDFTHPDPEFRKAQVEREIGWIRMTAELGGSFCRVLSGQRRPEVSREEGLDYAARCIEACLPTAEKEGVTLIIENHYKDDFWDYPEFAQHADIFCELVDRLPTKQFGVNYDPSNTLLAGEDPIELLDRVKNRVVSMHASDRYLIEGTIEDLRREETGPGYAKRLRHGTIGRGLNDYDAIFSRLAAVGFDGWISIEDGVDGMDCLRESVAFLRRKMAQHFHHSKEG